MIHYQLRCGAAHEFDAWFRDSAAYELQAAEGLLECPHCGERQVARALMAPAVPRRRGHGPGRPAMPLRPPGSAPAQPEFTPELAPQPPPQPSHGGASHSALATRPRQSASGLPDHVRAALQRLRGEVERRCDYVGPDFAREARRIHDGESPARGIYGEATEAQAEALAEDGIAVSQIPWLPRFDA